ncbi:MAG: DUF5320 domain-containing protein [Desulfobacterales bacterium]|nr:DUF5320 domain-containing protein [Desulfobacterales bacterium]MDD4071772.1 DUF5320 domain-containing protein [Desulfobacterales bacterium]MDD4393657.1 DUF5320 domain-containing protein [Desulfobacterales bacterium]
MPGGDRTGPAGMGSMTGRGIGYCAGYPAPRYGHPGYGRGIGLDRGFRGGRGGGYGYGWSNTISFPGLSFREQALQALKIRVSYLGGALETIEKQISNLEDAGE